jgi:hypothetical protein
MGAALVALGLATRAPAQLPGPPPGGGMPMYQPTFAGDPTPLPTGQFCPPGDAGQPPPSPFSLPNDGSPNAFSCDDFPCQHAGCFFSIGYMGLRRQDTGHGVLAVLDPGNNLPGVPPNADTGLGPGAGAPQALGYDDIRAPFLNGLRASLIYREDGRGFEVAGWYLNQSVGSATVAIPGRLDLPFAAFPSPVGFQGDNFLWLQADQVHAYLQSQLASAEANYRSTFAPGCDWLVGVRYLDLMERFNVTTDDDGLVLQQRGLGVNPTQVATVSATTHSHIIGPQLGFDCERALVSWLTVGITGKGAWGANFLQVDNSLTRGDSFMGPGVRHTTTVFSHLYDFSAWGTFALTEHMRIKAGYQLLWVCNVPQAQQQMNFDLGNPGGVRSNASSIFFHGPMVEFQFAF